MRSAALVVAVLLSAAAAGAEDDTLGGTEFEALSEGKTLVFTRDGALYGAEQYLPDRKVIWQYSDGSCLHGQWFADGNALCFIYEDRPTVQCWLFSERGGGFFARMADLPAGDPSELRLSQITDEPLMCPGPDLGV